MSKRIGCWLFSRLMHQALLSSDASEEALLMHQKRLANLSSTEKTNLDIHLDANV
jgi:hypothetical protein